MADDYFERQNSRDCVLHSFNNAFGRPAIKKEQVLERIDRMATELEDRLRSQGDLSEDEISNRIKKMRMRSSSGKTFFSADVVWDTAQELGVFYARVPIPGTATPFLRLDRLTEPCRQRPMVVLGEINKGTHAIAIRNNMLYDSERKSPVDLTMENLRKSLSVVYSIYVFVEDESALKEVKMSFIPEFGMSREM